MGQRFAFQLREKLRASPRFDLTEPDAAALGLYIVSIDLAEANSSGTGKPKRVSSALSIAISVQPGSMNRYWTSLVFVVGADRVDQMVERLLASIDADIERIRRSPAYLR